MSAPEIFKHCFLATKNYFFQNVGHGTVVPIWIIIKNFEMDESKVEYFCIFQTIRHTIP
jgi:hypothetical protein